MIKAEIRSANDATIEGYVNAVGRDSRVMRKADGSKFVEQIVPKTFEKAIGAAGNIEVRFNHKKVVGSTGAGTLDLWEDNIGLYARANVADPEIIEKARKKELRGWSFGFVCRDARWEDAGEGLQRRFIDDMELREVSILDKTPAYIATSIEMRDEAKSLLERRAEDEDCEVRELKTPKEDGINTEIYQKQVEILKTGGK